MPLSEFSYSEFVLFVYLCMANVDNDLSLHEIEVLFDKMDLEHFSSSSQNELLVGQVYKKYMTIPQGKRVEAIKKVAPKFLAEKQNGLQLLQNLFQIMKADGEIKSSEKNLFEEIERVVNELH
ncbi:MAG TPA: TerB family tellurite resistance protein [Bacteroidia bacterium]|nr:TerB family tellurite resistance protein [Bacteroidia bacterium]